MEKRLETKQMKLTKQTLKQIIKEELNKVLNEKETLKEGSVAYIKGGKAMSADVGEFQRGHEQGKSHLVNMSYSNEQDPIAEFRQAGESAGTQLDTKMAYAITSDLSQYKRLRYEIEKQIKATAGIEDALAVNVVFTL